MAEKPLSVRVNAEVDAWVRSLPNRTEWLRKVIEAEYKREKQQKEAG